MASTSQCAPVDVRVAEQLCLACGLCCDSTLFRDAELQPEDDATRLAALGLPVTQRKALPGRNGRSAILKLPQPCAALCADRRCRIYEERPTRCREFECALLKSVGAGRLDTTGALRIIRQTQDCAQKIRRLLRELGDTDERLPLSRRFRQTRRRLESGGLDEASAEVYAELTLAVHQLQLRLQREFHPGLRNDDRDALH